MQRGPQRTIEQIELVTLDGGGAGTITPSTGSADKAPNRNESQADSVHLPGLALLDTTLSVTEWKWG